MTFARNQPTCKKNNINIGCFNGKKITSRKVNQRNTSLFIQINHFCLIWESQKISFKQAIKDELKLNFRVVDKVISDKHVKKLIKFEYDLKKFKLQELI